MTAGSHRVIIEKGADYKIDVQVSEDGGIPKDITGYSAEMVIKYADTNGDVQVLDTVTVASNDPLMDDAVNGNLTVVIDKSKTATYPTLVDVSNPFTTEYNYFYTLDINQDGATTTSENMRVLRGKLAIRE